MQQRSISDRYNGAATGMGLIADAVYTRAIARCALVSTSRIGAGVGGDGPGAWAPDGPRPGPRLATMLATVSPTQGQASRARFGLHTVNSSSKLATRFGAVRSGWRPVKRQHIKNSIQIILARCCMSHSGHLPMDLRYIRMKYRKKIGPVRPDPSPDVGRSRGARTRHQQRPCRRPLRLR